MTKRITVSLPDDIAHRLERTDNASRYVAEAVRQRMDHERTLELLRLSGQRVTEADLAAAADAIDRAQGSVTPQVRTEAARLLAEITASRNRWPG